MEQWTDLDQAYLETFGEHPDVPNVVLLRSVGRDQDLESEEVEEG